MDFPAELVLTLKCHTNYASADDCLNKARSYWVRNQQSLYFKDELGFLAEPSAKIVPSLVKNLDLFIDDKGLLRSRGRLGRCENLSFDAQNPLLLPKQSYLTVLLVREAHESCKHLGASSTLSHLRRNGLWIPKGRNVIKAILRECLPCKKLNNFSFSYPKPGDYLPEKVTFIKPFNHVGIDFTGNFQVKLEATVIKMYLLVFSCLNTRAIHIEILPNMSCQQFLLAFIRFVNMFTLPEKVFSDNANTFLMGMGIVADSFSTDDFSDYLRKNNIRHYQIPLYSAWVGAFWERMMRVIKSCLFKVVGKKRLEYFQFLSLVSDIENVMNNRPLTYRDSDPDFEPITPNKFLKLDTSRDFIIDNVAGSDLQIPRRKELISSLEKRQEMLDTFRESFYNEYLLALRETSRDSYQGHWENRIKIGDIVLINVPNKPRPFWPMGRVLELLTGSDGKVRSVRLKRDDSSEGIHSINLLVPLEMEIAPSSTDGVDTTPNESGSAKERPPRRKAALRCEDIIKNTI